MKCPECGWSDAWMHANGCSRGSRNIDPEKPYEPPYFNEHGFLVADFRAWHWSRTRRELRKLLGKDKECKS